MKRPMKPSKAFDAKCRKCGLYYFDDDGKLSCTEQEQERGCFLSFMDANCILKPKEKRK